MKAEVPRRPEATGRQKGSPCHRVSGKGEDGRKPQTLPFAKIRDFDRQSDDESEYSDSYLSDSSETTSSEEPVSRRRRQGEKAICDLHDYRYGREVVAPGMFKGDGASSLKSYLRDYEQYFEAKYKGNQRQKAKHLGQYLEGSAKRAYDAIDGGALKYGDLKSKLLQWYQAEKVNQRSNREVAFETAQMLPTDTLTIYALRLERFASKAWPDSAKERERKLCRKFWYTVPSSFANVLASSERNLLLMSEKKRLDWKKIKKLAENEDRSIRKARDSMKDSENHIWYSQPAQPIPQTISRPNEYSNRANNC